MIRVLFVIGTRPEAIKLAPIIQKSRNYSGNILPIILTTSQHKELLDQGLKVFGIKADFDLNIMKKNQTLTDVTTKVISRVGEVLEKSKPDIVLVQGDTTTVLGSALAAFYKKIGVGHVEAGLRSFDKYNQYPEEINRKLTSVISSLHFAPTESAKQNLMREGIVEKDIYVTGNTVIDSLFMVLKNKWLNIPKEIDFNKKIILVTAHRRENFGMGLKNIAQALKLLASRDKDLEIIYPLHPNPNVQKIMKQVLGNIKNIKLVKPLDYVTFVNIMKKSTLILTDSGGVQEEAPSLGIPVLVLREVTERPEAVQVGCVKIVGTNIKKILHTSENLLNNKNDYQKMAKAINPYGDGKASERILKIIIKRYSH